jgi:PAS domain S-box-containing protein
MILPAVHILFVDVAGSVLMIVFSFLCLFLAHKLRSHDRNNVIWTYLLWVSYGLALFAISRSVGHILKQVLFLSGKTATWNVIQPFSGAINTMMFVVVASITLFFERIWIIYQQILKDKQALQSAHKELVYLNQNLEQIVSERTGALTRSEHNYRRIFEVSKDMIIVLNADGNIIELNPQGLNLLGCGQPDSGISENYFQSYLADRKDWTRLKGALVDQGYISNAEVTLKRADGAAIRSLVSGSLDSSSDNGAGTIHLLVKDIEQKRLMEEQIAQADKLASIGQLSAGVAHEINNPLGIILGYTQLLMRNGNSSKEHYDDLKIIEKHAKNCQSIVADLLSFSRSSKTEKEIKNVHEVIDDVLTFVQQHTGLEGVDIIREYDQTLPAIVIDEKKIKQVFINLMMNAIHAVGKTGIIKLSSEFDSGNGQIIVKISDTGHGIEKKHLPRIFDPFFTTKPTGEGTGLGLSVSYGIIKNHGGDILVETQPDKGSTFTVVLPVVSETKGIQ